ncbi:hypothetical protein [Pseudoroseicyclus aestuarii]|uniref:Uncharacterized protein n=1 Tax=Pseudoroseicyclus aestuarii TaxID=1795041 RepID=A0A318SNJ1_9RHOB|nr:hypothetical protein [Pseudoroseicyclus aestuarii]PYE82383.1 hypothetical protein DFP88_104139 [Pseudoroseicyclus aestuarii]
MHPPFFFKDHRAAPRGVQPWQDRRAPRRHGPETLRLGTGAEGTVLHDLAQRPLPDPAPRPVRGGWSWLGIWRLRPPPQAAMR